MLILLDRFMGSVVASAICWVCSQGVFVFSVAEAWYEGVCLRRVAAIDLLDTGHEYYPGSGQEH
jgi:hypothetical protein